MRTPRSALLPRLRAGVVLLVVLALGRLVLPTSAARAAAPDPAAPGLSIGTFNTNLQPWLPHEDEVVDTIRSTRFDVLGLQGVFSQAAADRITGDATIKQQYPYAYFVPGKQQAGKITSVSQTEMENYINCVIGRGSDTQTLVQPVTPIDAACEFLGLNVAFLSQPAFETLNATMQILAKGQAALQAIDLGKAGNGVKYSTGGSARPAGAEPLPAHRRRHVRLHDVPDPPGQPLRHGRRGPDRVRGLAEQRHRGHRPRPRRAADRSPAARHRAGAAGRTSGANGVDVAVGSFSSGTHYQPEGYQLLLENGYTPVTASDLPTFCPTSHAGLDTCQGQPTRDVDHILTSTTGRCRAPDAFATTPVSRHIGLSAVCAKTGTSTAKADAYRLDQGTDLTVAAPGVLANDADRSRTVLLRTAPMQAQAFTLRADGSFAYTPVPGFSGTDRFTYVTDDGTATPTTVTLTVTPTANLSVSLSAPAAATAGGTFSATLVVRNAGPGTASQVASGLTLPSGLTVTWATGGVITRDRRSVAFLAGEIALGASVSYPVTVSVDRSVSGTRTLTGATASLQTKDPSLRDNAAQANVAVKR